MGQLSEAGQRVQDALRGLSPDERALVVSRGLTNLATQINAIAGAVAPQSRANAQVALTQGVAEKLITQGGGISLGEKPIQPFSSIKKAKRFTDEVKVARAHGFKQIVAPDGAAAIEVKLTRYNGKEMTYLLPDGARGKLYMNLADYGKTKLRGCTFLNDLDFEIVVKSLYQAICDQRVVNRDLQTDDLALKEAYQIVTQGVRRDGGLSWVTFEVDEGGSITGRRVSHVDYASDYYIEGGYCGLFGYSPAELE